MTIHTPNLCYNNQTILPAGIFLYPDRFHSTHTLVWDHYWPATESCSCKDKVTLTFQYLSPHRKNQIPYTSSVSDVRYYIYVTQHPEKSRSQRYLLNSGFTNSLNGLIHNQFLEVYGLTLTLLPTKAAPILKNHSA